MIIPSDHEDGLIVRGRIVNSYLGKIGLSLLSHVKINGSKSPTSSYNINSETVVLPNTITIANTNDDSETNMTTEIIIKNEISQNMDIISFNNTKEEIEMNIITMEQKANSVHKAIESNVSIRNIGIIRCRQYQEKMKTLKNVPCIYRPTSLLSSTTMTTSNNVSTSEDPLPPISKTIQFSQVVSVIEIPRREYYTYEQKNLMWFRRKCLRQMMERNRLERLYEQIINGGVALEEHDFRLYKGHLIHPANLPVSELSTDTNQCNIEFNRIAIILHNRRAGGHLLPCHRTLITGVFGGKANGRE